MTKKDQKDQKVEMKEMEKSKKVTKKDQEDQEELDSPESTTEADNNSDESSDDVDVVSSDEIEDAEKENKIESREVDAEVWTPKTQLGINVKQGKINTIDQILDSGSSILEAEIVDILIPNLEKELLMIGQSKGKFGGGKRRVFKQTQKKTREGNKPKFATMAVVGDKNGHVGLGFGKAKETVPAREKAFRNAKLNIFKIRRGSGDWESEVSENPTSIPFKVTGKCGSVEITLIPAPRGTGLCVEKECAKILSLAGIQDVWSKTKGQTKTKLNLIKACEEALRQLILTKTQARHYDQLGIVDGGKAAEATMGEVDTE